MKEIYQQSYVAFPIKEGPLLKYIKTINPNKKFAHFTIHMLTEVDDDKLRQVKDVILANRNLIVSTILRPQELDIVGVHGKTLVLKIENTKEIEELHELFEKNFGITPGRQIEFLPHISIYKDYRGSGSIKLPKNAFAVNSKRPYRPENIGVYYRTEENATALLFSHKI
ncbi:MAG: hypothetical protein HYV90_01225 [Candidatus Woesebacteria bacterium]|nr:MAG: hypothetical protein HYV90_01225 [Candidatus Woesebacteria bacterium]